MADSNSQPQFNWTQLLSQLIPMAMAANGLANSKNTIADSAAINSYNNAQNQFAEQQRQKNQDAWNKMIEEEQLKSAKLQNQILQDSYFTPTEADVDIFKGTPEESQWFEPSTTKTTTSLQGDVTPDTFLNNKPKDPFAIQMPGAQDNASNIGITTKTETVPEKVRGGLVSRAGYNAALQDAQNQQAAKEQQAQKNQAYQDYINSLDDKNPIKPLLSTALRTGNTAVIDKAMQSMLSNSNQGITPYQREKLNIDWYNATHKGEKQHPDQKDPLNLSIKDLSAIMEKDPTMAKKLAGQYSLAIRNDIQNNVNNPQTMQRNIANYNYLTGSGYTIPNWQVQAQKNYNPATNSPVRNNNGSKGGHKLPPLGAKSNTNSQVKMVQVRNKKTHQLSTAYVGIKDGQYYSTPQEAMAN